MQKVYSSRSRKRKSIVAYNRISSPKMMVYSEADSDFSSDSISTSTESKKTLNCLNSFDDYNDGHMCNHEFLFEALPRSSSTVIDNFTIDYDSNYTSFASIESYVGPVIYGTSISRALYCKVT